MLATIQWAAEDLGQVHGECGPLWLLGQVDWRGCSAHTVGRWDLVFLPPATCWDDSTGQAASVDRETVNAG